MKKIFVLLLAGLLSAGVPTAFAQANPKPPPTPEQQAAKVKEKWTKALTDARRDFQNSNDRESAQFVDELLDSLNQPDGLSPQTLTANGKRINSRIRELVQSGALESAATFQVLEYHVYQSNAHRSEGPAHPNHKTGGTPGPSGLVLYLPFDKPDENGVIHDQSGAGNDGKVFGAKWVAEGKSGGAYQFRITNLTDRIVIPNSDLLNPDYVTLAAWIKTADRDGFWNRIIDNGSYALSLGGDDVGKAARGKLELDLSNGYMASDRALDDNLWHHVAATYDGKTLRCYIDGVEKSKQAKTPGPLKKTAWNLCIGNSDVDYGTGEFLAFEGLIDEVRIYNRALSSDEIKALAFATHAGADIFTPAAGATPNSDAAERLKQLKALYDQGLINKEDYDKKRQDILNSL